MNAIIFLAPISAFDQQLAEVRTRPRLCSVCAPCVTVCGSETKSVREQDPRVNRLEDSFQLWKSVIESRLLAHVNIVLFLNKCDLLKKKLESGVRLAHHMPSYNRPNDYETVSQCAYYTTTTSGVGGAENGTQADDDDRPTTQISATDLVRCTSR